MPNNDQMEKFRTVLDAEKDPFLKHILQLHGPFDSHWDYVENKYQEVRCMACYVIWPCSTFLVLHNRMTHIQRELAKRNT